MYIQRSHFARIVAVLTLILTADTYGQSQTEPEQFISINRSFSFSHRAFSANFPMQPTPMGIESSESPQLVDHVKFFSDNGVYPFLFEVTVKGTTDGDNSIESIVKRIKSTTKDAAPTVVSPCDLVPATDSCVRFQDIAYRNDLPVYVTDNIAFHKEGRTFFIVAANFAPATYVKTKEDLSTWRPDGSTSMAKMALKSFVASFRIIPKESVQQP